MNEQKIDGQNNTSNHFHQVMRDPFCHEAFVSLIHHDAHSLKLLNKVVIRDGLNVILFFEVCIKLFQFSETPLRAGLFTKSGQVFEDLIDVRSHVFHGVFKIVGASENWVSETDV